MFSNIFVIFFKGLKKTAIYIIEIKTKFFNCNDISNRKHAYEQLFRNI